MPAILSAAAHSRPSRRRRSLIDYLGLYRQRRALATLDEAALRDIGLSRSQAAAESSRPFWDVPATWRR